MTPFYRVFLCAVVIVMMLTAGCTLFPSTTAPPALITPGETAVATPWPAEAAPSGTTQPGAAGTPVSSTCTAEISSDAANCGGCGYACPANALCQQGQCYCKNGFTSENNHCVVALATTSSGNVCPAGMSPCTDGNCYDLASSPAHCGLCGNMCPAGMICSASTCTNVPTETTSAPATTATTTTTTPSPVISGIPFNPGLSKACFLGGGTICDGTCVNLSTSNGNCGACGNICTGLTKTCCGGTCINLKTSWGNCGTCGHKCPPFSSCVSGSCKAQEDI
jgi:hypothetical protein